LNKDRKDAATTEKDLHKDRRAIRKDKHGK